MAAKTATSVVNKRRVATRKALHESGEVIGLSELTDEDAGFPIGRATHVDTRLGFIMHDISRLRRSAFDQVMKNLGVTRAQWWVIAHLSRHDGMMQVQLADMLDIGKASLGNLVERLEVGGWIDRRLDPVDGRVKRVYLKRKARQLIETMHGLEYSFNEESLAGISRAQRDEMLTVLTAIKGNLLGMISATAEATNESSKRD